MKKTLLLIAVLSAATFSFAGDNNAAADKAKCDAKSEKCCCCCCCKCCSKDAKDSKSTCAKDATCKDAKDTKSASAPVTH